MIRTVFTMLASILLMASGVAAGEAVDWKAKWIWQEDDGPANAWVMFRRKVNVEEVPQRITANISADSKYWLWINGELVVFEGSVARGPSPARPWKRMKEMWDLPPEEKPSNTWYEEVDITSHLKEGENTFAVLAWYWGRETHKGTHIDSGQGGFIFQADLNGKKLISDRSWKVKADPAYALDSGDTGKMVVQHNVKYDARNEMGEWTLPSFSDNDWTAATEKGIPPAAPWFNLEKNYVPALVNHGLKNYENYPESEFPLVSTGETISCVLPFNQQITPYLEVECGEGLEINITTDNKLNKINAFYTTKKGKQSFESLSWMNGHQVKYEIPKGVKVLGLKYRWMSVGEMAGSFECSDPFFERLWWMGRNTLYVCARDNFMDCPDRERACWIGDVADQAGYLFYCMDDSGRQLLKKAIRITMDYSHQGVYGALGPLRIRELPSQSLQFVEQGIWQYYLNTGDEETLRYAYPFVRDYLNLWSMQENGLPKRQKRWLDSWNWSDWGQKGTIDEHVILDAFYFMALNSAKEMALELGETGDVAWLDERIQTMKKGFNKEYWNGTYYTSKPGTLQDDRANALAILSGLAGRKKYASIVENVLIPNHFCSPHFEWMVEDAMCRAGCYEGALQRMKERYQSQVDREDMTTLYEKFPNGGSYNHAWNAPNTILSKCIAGIRPVQPGWSEFEVLPTMAHLTSIKTVVSSVKGNIEADIQRRDKTFDVALKFPNGTAAIAGVPKSIGRVAEVRANEQLIWRAGTYLERVAGIEAAGEDERFIKFRVPTGTWRISASYR